MLIWVLEIGEPIQGIDGDARDWRAGMLSKALTDRGHTVIWWASTFNHAKKKHRFDETRDIEIHPHLKVKLLHGPGYHSNKSLRRIIHHNVIANEFARESLRQSKPDVIFCCLPILELAEKLKSTGSKDDWKLGQILTPKQRNFAPIIIRGEEDDGVKFWGFGITVYTELMQYMVDPDYGDIVDIMSGRDITVSYKTKEQTGTNYPSTSIRIKPNQTSIADDAKLLEKILNEQIEITEVYKEPTYEDLEKELELFLNPESQDVEVESTSTRETKSDSIEDVMNKFKQAVK